MQIDMQRALARLMPEHRAVIVLMLTLIGRRAAPDTAETCFQVPEQNGNSVFY